MSRTTATVLLLVAVVVALAGVAAEGARAAPAGASATLQGRVPASAGPLARVLSPRVVAIGLIPGGEQAAVRPSRNRRYRLRVRQGIYAVAMTTWAGRRGVTRARIVCARANRRTVVSATRSQNATPARVSVGRIRGPGGIDLSPLILGDLVDKADNAP